MAGIKDTYVVHCAVTVCDMGLRESKLVLEKSHGVYLKEKAQVSIKDQLGMINVIGFGGCISAQNPSTIAAAQAMAAKVAAEKGVKFSSDIMDTLTNTGEDGRCTMTCSGVCTPSIISPEWDNEKEDVTVGPGKKALLGEATLTCVFGGFIKVVETGQPL